MIHILRRAINMALWLQTLVTFGQGEIQTMEWIFMGFCSETHAPNKMNCNNLDDPLKFYLALSSDHSFLFLSICVLAGEMN